MELVVKYRIHNGHCARIVARSPPHSQRPARGFGRLWRNGRRAGEWTPDVAGSIPVNRIKSGRKDWRQLPIAIGRGLIVQWVLVQQSLSGRALNSRVPALGVF